MSKNETQQTTLTESQSSAFASALLKKLQEGQSLFGLKDTDKHFIEKLTGGTFKFIDKGDASYDTYLENTKVDAISALQNYIDTAPEKEIQAQEDAKKSSSWKKLTNTVRNTRNGLAVIAGTTFVGGALTGAGSLGIDAYNYLNTKTLNNTTKAEISQQNAKSEAQALREKKFMIRQIDGKEIKNPNTTPKRLAEIREELRK